MVRGDFRIVAAPWYHLAPTRVRVTNKEAQFLQTSGKKGSIWLQLGTSQPIWD
jgi:hypothetical protein